ncbi:MAG: methyltransferase domain-containing protein [Alphaproteobacteria bacterium]|nr:MAG: methyltransferase domain-containing protein [Alphaproteobacteria bacterium]
MNNVVKKLIPQRYHKLAIDYKDLIINNQRRVNRRNVRMIEGLLRSNKPIKLELGAGVSRSLDGWTTIDRSYACDISLDLSFPLPFPNNCVSIIYSSHLLEHFSYPEPMTNILAECYRILKPYGIFSIAVPNAGIYLKAYFYPEEFEYEKYCRYKPAFQFNSKIDYVNYIAYMDGNHHYMFDEENLLVILTDAGFRNVRLRDFDPTLDLENRRYETIYAVGVK